MIEQEENFIKLDSNGIRTERMQAWNISKV